MKKGIYSLITKFGGLVAAFAVVVTSLTSNSTCLWITYQPEEPEEVKALKRTEWCDEAHHYYNLNLQSLS